MSKIDILFYSCNCVFLSKIDCNTMENICISIILLWLLSTALKNTFMPWTHGLAQPGLELV